MQDYRSRRRGRKRMGCKAAMLLYSRAYMNSSSRFAIHQRCIISTMMQTYPVLVNASMSIAFGNVCSNSLVVFARDIASALTE